MVFCCFQRFFECLSTTLERMVNAVNRQQWCRDLRRRFLVHTIITGVVSDKNNLRSFRWYIGTGVLSLLGAQTCLLLKQPSVERTTNNLAKK